MTSSETKLEVIPLKLAIFDGVLSVSFFSLSLFPFRLLVRECAPSEPFRLFEVSFSSVLVFRGWPDTHRFMWSEHLHGCPVYYRDMLINGPLLEVKSSRFLNEMTQEIMIQRQYPNCRHFVIAALDYAVEVQSEHEPDVQVVKALTLEEVRNNEAIMYPGE